MKRYSEEFIGDAYNICKYFRREGDSIGVAMVRVEDFPNIPKSEMGETAFAVRLTRLGNVVVECMYKTTDVPINKKHLGNGLISAQVGDAIRRQREKMGMTLKDLSEITGLTQNSLCAIECGRYNLNLRLLGVLLAALKCEIEIKSTPFVNCE